MDNEYLKAVYETKPNKEAAELIGVSVPTLLKMIDAAGINRKGSGRPYKKRESVYVSNCVRSINKLTGNLKATGLFHMLLLDEEMSNNNWAGLSSIKAIENGDDYRDCLSVLYIKGLIGQFEIIDGFISTSINNRDGFVLTSEEYTRIYR